MRQRQASLRAKRTAELLRETRAVDRNLIKRGLITAAHDVSDGGLWTTLVEMALPRGLGFEVITDSEIREDAFLFGEGQGRAVV